jgi:hypothetical protein
MSANALLYKAFPFVLVCLETEVLARMHSLMERWLIVARIRIKTETGVAAIFRVIASTSSLTLLEAIVSSAVVAIAGIGVLMMFDFGVTQAPVLAARARP